MAKGDAGVPGYDAWLSAVLDATEAGVVVFDADGRFLLCNAQAERILGMTRDEISVRHPTAASWPLMREDGTPWPVEDRPVATTLRTGEAVRARVVGVPRRDGTCQWVRVTSAPLRRSGAGEVSGAVVSLVDVASVIDEVTALRSQSRRQAEIIGGAQSTTVQADLRARTMEFGAELARMLGYEPGEFPTRMEQREGSVHPDDAGEFARALASMDPEGRFRFDERVRHKNGSWLWVRIHLQVVERDAVGRPVRVAGTLTNIQAEKQEVLDARERAGQLRAIFDSTAAGMAFIGPDDRFGRANATLCGMLGYSPAELQGLTWRSLVADADLRDMAELMHDLTRGARDSFSATSRCRRKDGTLLNGLVSFSLVRRDARGVHLLMLVGDVASPAAAGRSLPALLCTCMHCSKVRDHDGRWEDLAHYLLHATDTRVSHGICPECVARYYRDDLS